ncbi:hypothetical protein T03_8617 [Trichinella britovi]|uniref:Uncharacterized protein n=1 Tax=Trichinella britovi TaxID=45882 RepID=A0A0V1D8D7_TRIBR|nr:hypothetical protein T03_8617 [Trichinella britovi]
MHKRIVLSEEIIFLRILYKLLRKFRRFQREVRHLFTRMWKKRELKNISSVDLLITFFNLFFKMSNIAIASDNFQHHCSMYCQSFYLSQTAGDRH